MKRDERFTRLVALPLGTVGLDWQFAGFGNFGSGRSSDMILRNSTTGGLQVYDIANNQITNTGFMGTVGLEWQVVGVGDFSNNPGETDLMMRNSNTGGFEVYDITNNQIVNSNFMGTVGKDWAVVGFGPMNGAGSTDMVLKETSPPFGSWAIPGTLEVYDIANNHITGAVTLGAVGLSVAGGFAADPPTGSMGSSGASTSQLVQAMAGFGGGSGAAESLNTAPLAADTSQQTLLTTPQHV